METGSDLKTGQTCPIHHMTECCGRKVSIEDSLRAERDRLAEEVESLKRTSDFQEKVYLSEHGGSWGECRFQAKVKNLQGDVKYLSAIINDSKLSKELTAAKAQMGKLVEALEYYCDHKDADGYTRRYHNVWHCESEFREKALARFHAEALTPSDKEKA